MPSTMTTASWRSPSPRSANYCLMITLDLVLTAHVYNNDVLDRCACCVKLILISVVFVLAEMDNMIELECYVMVKWISNVR